MSFKGPEQTSSSTKIRLDNILVDGLFDGHVVELRYIKALNICPIIHGAIRLVEEGGEYQISVIDLTKTGIPDFGGSFGITIELDSEGNVKNASHNRPYRLLENPEGVLEEILMVLEEQI
ncbi:hypothetical protein JKY72_05580 [Candidatus Gracilibacteria bacterium]|nr:hypothetical protein [Candidatus Gracilibacteria bacterium]